MSAPSHPRPRPDRHCHSHPLTLSFSTRPTHSGTSTKPKLSRSSLEPCTTASTARSRPSSLEERLSFPLASLTPVSVQIQPGRSKEVEGGCGCRTHHEQRADHLSLLNETMFSAPRSSLRTVWCEEADGEDMEVLITVRGGPNPGFDGDFGEWRTDNGSLRQWLGESRMSLWCTS